MLGKRMAVSSVPNTKRGWEDDFSSWRGKVAAKLCRDCPQISVSFISSMSLTGAFMLSLPLAVGRLLSPELGMGKARSWSQGVRETEARENTDPGQGKWVQEPKALKSPSMQQRSPS